jgi:ATP-dependent Clp protease ATP-binding subunit ClpX
MLLNKYIDHLPNPLNIIKKLDEYIIGQTNAKKNLAVLLLVRSALKLQRNKIINLDVDIQKCNLLLIGPTGSGKTELIKSLSKITGIPILIRDVTGITEAGYLGFDVEDILIDYIDLIYDWCTDLPSELLPITSDEPLDVLRERLFFETIETGIIYLDEVDKLASTSDSRNKVGSYVQNELLKILEGNLLPLRTGHYDRKCKANLSSINIKDITFICGGAFSGLSDIIYDRLSKTNPIGFNSQIGKFSKTKEIHKLLTEVTNDDLVQFGFKQEFLGRLPLKTCLEELNLTSMTKVITEPKDCIFKRYKEFFGLFNVNLDIDKTGIKEIAQNALDLKTGARSLHQIFNKLLLDDLVNVFDLKNKDLRLSKHDVIKRLK